MTSLFFFAFSKDLNPNKNPVRKQRFSKRTTPSAVVAERQQRPDICKAECHKALKLNPRYSRAALKRANYYIAEGQYDKAVRDCQKIWDHDSSNMECKSV